MEIKVVHIITKLELGGAQNNTLYTVKHLDKSKFKTILITGKGGILDEEAKTLSTIFIDELVREISPLNDIKALFEIYKILKKEKPDIVHTHSSKAGILGRIAAFLAGVKVIIHTYHGFGFNDYQKIYVKYFYIFLEKIVSYLTHFLIFVSNDNIRIAKKYFIGNKKKYILIRSGIKLSHFKKEKKYELLKRLKIKKENNTIISTVANFKPQKNPDDFYYIAKKLIKEKENVYFIYAGGGERLEYFRNLSRNDKIDSRLFFTGWIDDSRLIYDSSDIFILTSLWEGLPRSLVEAMASGVIPVCYKTDGVIDIIKDGENGFMVEKGEKDKMYKILINLIEDDNLYNRIKNNLLKTDLSEFDIDLMVKKQEELYLGAFNK